MPYPQKLRAFLDDLAFFSDRQERIEALISIGQRYQNHSPEEVPRTDATRVPGCESEVFVASRPEGAGRKYLFAVDNPQGISAMALAEILDENLSGEPLEEVAELPDDVVYEIFGKELSMGKSLGLTGMIRMVKAEAQKGSSR